MLKAWSKGDGPKAHLHSNLGTWGRKDPNSGAHSPALGLVILPSASFQSCCVHCCQPRFDMCGTKQPATLQLYFHLSWVFACEAKGSGIRGRGGCGTCGDPGPGQNGAGASHLCSVSLDKGLQHVCLIVESYSFYLTPPKH